jgi:hypothetical protein
MDENNISDLLQFPTIHPKYFLFRPYNINNYGVIKND